jgi:hypothetical protein
MKRLMHLAAAVALVLSVAACTSNNGDDRTVETVIVPVPPSESTVPCTPGQLAS